MTKIKLGIALPLLLALLGCGGNSNENSVTPQNEVVEIYLGSATIPGIGQILKIIEDQNDNKKLTTFARHTLPEHIEEKYNAEDSNRANLNSRAFELLSEYEEEVDVIIHGNTYHHSHVTELLHNISQLDNVNIKRIEMFDDGIAEYLAMHSMGETESPEMQEYNLAMGSIHIQASIDNPTVELPVTPAVMYGWHNDYNVRYNMVRPDYLEINEKIETLANHIGANSVEMKWDQYAHFSSEQRSDLLDIVGFNPDDIQELYDASSYDNLIYIGTRDSAACINKQIQIIRSAITDEEPIPQLVKHHDLFYKGHPGEDDTTHNSIVDHFRDEGMMEIDKSIPFEILQMVGLLPDTIGGMSSTVFMTMPKDADVEIPFIVFNGSSDGNNPQLEIMKTLDIVDDEQVFYLNDFQDTCQL
ncbi:putative Alpha-/beta-galactoside alpha-2,3-sialyltransferase [Vibrio chagasii]|nr:putative Alpha-/beta-galactoside alpha-2,3-sialyltransferase [Vibrio chagasii]